jgi:hypothetical protein
MLMFGYLETSPESWRIANFVAMGSTIIQADVPQSQMLKANRAIRGLMRVISTGRIARPISFSVPADMYLAVETLRFSTGRGSLRSRWISVLCSSPGRPSPL